MTIVASLTAATAFKKLAEEITKDLYTKFKESLESKIDQIEALKNLDQLRSKISDISKVKTVWQTDKPVDLFSFYCKTHVIFDDKRLELDNISDIDTVDNLLIEGIAGQGKSILLRYLCIKELDSGNSIPVFIELRRLTDKDNIEKLIYIKLRELGFNISEDVLIYLCKTSRFIFY